MPVYNWAGKTRRGSIEKGEIEAPDEKAARAQLIRRNITPTKVKARPKDIFENVAFLQPKITAKDVVIFTRQFSTMIDAGLPLVQGLDILASQQENKAFKKLLGQVKGDVESGSTFAEALGKHPRVFDELFVNLIAAGETGGILDTILQRLSAYIEKAEKLKKQVKGAMVYPISVVVIAFVVIAILLIFVIPVFQEMFADFGKALPAPTQMVVNMSEFMKGNILYIIAAIAAFVFAFKKFYSWERGRKIVDNLALKAPIFGDLIKKVGVARFTRTLGTMLSSGVPVLDGLDITSRTAGNKTIEEAVIKTRTAITEGKNIAPSLSETGVFPSMVVQMISVGEATGSLDTMLNKIADFYDEEVDAAVDALTSLLEPLLMVFLGGSIGGLVIAMYLPIFQMAGAVGG
jgi:type IV pilus assembly protein PilC